MRDVAVLRLCGHPQLLVAGTTVALQRKGLALLGYLAVEGAAAREHIADLLWGHEDSANNLRVELHRLRTALRGVAPGSFPAGEDPLTLPAAIETEPITDPEQLMLGLENVSSAFGDWLGARRNAQSDGGGHALVRTAKAQELARSVRPPHVILLRGEPESGRETFARSLARLLGLPVVYGSNGPADAVHYLGEDEPDDPELVRRILTDKRSVWVLASSLYSSDTRLALEVRAGYPPARFRHVTLEPLTWPEARESVLSDVPFDEAARDYVFSGGHLGFLSELVATRPFQVSADYAPVPQRIRATFLLKAQHLGEAAFEATQHLAVHPGPIPEPLIEAFGAEPFLDRLESLGWLLFDGAYSFTTEAGRRVLYEAMAPGQRVRAHRRAAEALEGTAFGLAAAYHGEKTGEHQQWARLVAPCKGWAHAVVAPYEQWNRGASPIPSRRAVPGRELALLNLGQGTPNQPVRNGTLAWWRVPRDTGTHAAEFELPGKLSILRIRMRTYVTNPAGVGLQCDAVPLRLTVRGSATRSVVWADVEAPGTLADGTTILPLDSELDAAFLVDQKVARVESRAFAGIIEGDLALHTARPIADAPRGTESVPTFDLT